MLPGVVDGAAADAAEGVDGGPKRKAGMKIPEDNAIFDVFSRTKAIQKATRNALAAFIPEEIEQTVIAMFEKDPSRVERIQTERSRRSRSCRRRGASSREMQRGKALHLIHERAVRLMLEADEPVIPPELVKTLADEVLGEVAVPFEEHDFIRESAYRLGSEIAVDPESVVAVETLFALDVPLPCPRGCGQTPFVDAGMICDACGGAKTVNFEVRCRIDFAEVLGAGLVVHVEDLKSSRAAVSQDELGRKRPDGTLAASNFQLILYALALAYGVPVREETCKRCDGTGTCCASQPDPHICRYCRNGRVETREPFPVASRAAVFNLEYVYPGIEGLDGKMVRRSCSLTRGELEAYRPSLAGLVRRLVADERSGAWPAVVSDAACSECPARPLCPIPVELRDHRGTVNTPEEAAEAFEVRARVTAEQRAIQKELRAFVERHGPVRYGAGMVAEVAYSESESVTDKDGLFGAVEMAVRYGDPFDRSKYVKVRGSRRLVERPLSADELLEIELEGPDGEGDAGDAAGGRGGHGVGGGGSGAG
jgi:hypothetical protein